MAIHYVLPSVIYAGYPRLSLYLFFLVHNVVKPGVCHLAEPRKFLDLLDLYSSCACVFFFLHNIGSIL